MAFDPQSYDAALDRAAAHARRWLSTVSQRPIPPSATADGIAKELGGPLQDAPTDPAEVVDLLADVVEPGLMAIGSGRFFGWVMGGTLPASLAADWMVSAWDQNTGIRYATPGTAAAEEAAGHWLLDLLGLPSGSDVGFTTGATMANFVGLAAARQALLTDAGWDLDRLGLNGSPPVTVLVGEQRHDSVDMALRYLGMGAPTAVPSDDQGRIRLEPLAAAIAESDGPLLLALQAGNLHSGAFDPIGEAVSLARSSGRPTWVHVDGAFGLFAAASPRLRTLVPGLETADSWCTDAHKTLNVPYDCGIAIVRQPEAVRAAFSMHTAYLVIADEHGPADPLAMVPEMSRRARGVPVWAALKSLGREGVAHQVEQLVANAKALAAGIATVDTAEVLNDVDFTQVSVAFGSDERTKDVTQRLLADGTAWMSGSRWNGRAVLRVSVSNWSTDEDDVARSVDAVRRAAAASQTP